MELTSTWSKTVPIVERVIIKNLFKGIGHVGKVPSFSELIGLRSKLTSRTVRSRIRVGNYIINCMEDDKTIELFRSDKISHTKFLAEISKKKEKILTK